MERQEESDQSWKMREKRYAFAPEDIIIILAEGFGSFACVISG